MIKIALIILNILLILTLVLALWESIILFCYNIAIVVQVRFDRAEVDGCGPLKLIQQNQNCFHSSIQCQGSSNIDRVCRLKNLLIFEGGIYYVTGGGRKIDKLPPLDSRLHLDTEADGLQKKFHITSFQESPLVFAKSHVNNIHYVPKGIIWARNASNPHVYHNTIDDSSIIHHHLCNYFGYCHYDPQNHADLHIIFNDGLVFKENPYTKQLWSCFTPNKPILPDQVTKTIHIIQDAVIGVGQNCMHFYICNSFFWPQPRSIYPQEERDGWLELLRECALNGTQKERQQQNRITIVNRQKQYHRSFVNENEILTKVQLEYPSYDIKMVYLENLTMVEQAYEIFGRSKVVIAMHGAALTNVLFMKNCSAVVAAFPFGHNADPQRFLSEPYIFGNVGVVHYMQQHARIAFMSYHVNRMSDMKLDLPLLEQNEEFKMMTFEEREEFLKNGVCPQKHRFICLFYWLHRASDVVIDLDKLMVIVDTAVAAAEMCIGTAMTSDQANDNGKWMLADCSPPTQDDIVHWQLEDGRIVSPSPEACCDKSCGSMYGWLLGSVLNQTYSDTAQDCCDACKRHKKCNAWNYCPCSQGCGGYTPHTCLLKHVADPSLPWNITEDIGLHWLGGVNLPTDTEMTPRWKCGKNETGDLDCVSEECHALQGEYVHPDLEIIQIFQFKTEEMVEFGVSPARCCEACKQKKGCNVWVFCNNPQGCLFGQAKAFTCYLKSIPTQQISELRVLGQGIFTSKVSGVIQLQN